MTQNYTLLSRPQWALMQVIIIPGLSQETWRSSELGMTKQGQAADRKPLQQATTSQIRIITRLTQTSSSNVKRMKRAASLTIISRQASCKELNSEADAAAWSLRISTSPILTVLQTCRCKNRESPIVLKCQSRNACKSSANRPRIGSNRCARKLARQSKTRPLLTGVGRWAR